MKPYKIVIVGGGTAGWFTAAWMSKFYKCQITLVESANIKKIGVGESVSPHIQRFFDLLGLDKADWMIHTGAIYKYANKFDNWVNKQGETEYFAFNYATSTVAFDRPEFDPSVIFDQTEKTRVTDVLIELIARSEVNKFDKYFNDHFHYMDNDKAPFKGTDYLLDPFYSWGQHINADLATEYIRDKVGIPNGVEHILADIADVKVVDGIVKSVICKDGLEIAGDVFIDASGFAGLLVNKIGLERIPYKDIMVNSAYVCQIDYTDPHKEMVNYTQSHAMDYGWRFKADVYHRMGTGYCFSSQHISNDQALEEFSKHIPNNRFDPKLIKWTPGRLEKAAQGNVFSIGLSSGFIEPLEANSLFIITANIMHMGKVLKHYEETGILDFNEYNKTIAHLYDDVADFVRVHYTLSNRRDTSFWNDYGNLRNRADEEEMVKQKYFANDGRLINSIEYTTMYPDHVWIHLAVAWGVDISGWKLGLDDATIAKGKEYFISKHDRNKLRAESCTNNYEWLKENIFRGMSPAQWEAEFMMKKKML